MDRIKETRPKIVTLLESVDRPGMDGMTHMLDTTDFFTAPASTKYHGCYPGGLADHSLRVYEILDDKFQQLHDIFGSTKAGAKPLPVDDENIIIAALLHDVCKIGAYLPTKKPDAKMPFYSNKQKPKGHAELSITRIKAFIELKPIEEMMIRFHMGIYHAIEYDEKAGEYHLLNQKPELSKEERYGQSLRNAWYHNPIVKLMYFCDELATMEEKAKEADGI